jgi:hypothetical protein
VSRLAAIPGVADSVISVHPGGRYKDAVPKAVVPIAYLIAEGERPILSLSLSRTVSRETNKLIRRMQIYEYCVFDIVHFSRFVWTKSPTLSLTTLPIVSAAPHSHPFAQRIKDGIPKWEQILKRLGRIGPMRPNICLKLIQVRWRIVRYSPAGVASSHPRVLVFHHLYIFPALDLAVEVCYYLYGEIIFGPEFSLSRRCKVASCVCTCT